MPKRILLTRECCKQTTLLIITLDVSQNYATLLGTCTLFLDKTCIAMGTPF